MFEHGKFPKSEPELRNSVPKSRPSRALCSGSALFGSQSQSSEPRTKTSKLHLRILFRTHSSGTTLKSIATAEPGVPAPGSYGSPDGSCPEVAESPGHVQGR